jgi:hypothetical protein
MAKERILIGCRLPNGIILTDPQDKDVKVKIAGNAGEKLGSGIFLPPRAVATTDVDLDLWTRWKAAYTGFPPLKTRAIFEARDEREAAVKAKDTQRTGFEQISQTPVIDGVKLEKMEA